MKRCVQYGALRCSTRTTPVELGACTNSSPPTTMATWEAACCDGRAVGPDVAKNTRSPGARSAGAVESPDWNCSLTARGSPTPYWAHPHLLTPPPSHPPLGP